jgi:hypothetical protein
MLALLWLCATGYKDNVDNAKELFKSVFVDEATCSFRPPKLNITPNARPADNDVDVHVCDDDDVFRMVNVDSFDQDIKSGANAVLDMATPGDVVNEGFKEWISLKVDWLTWLLNE